MARYLFIVARDQPELGAHLAREIPGGAGVHVVLDRRCSDRRRRAEAEVASDRRRAARRTPAPIEHALHRASPATSRARWAPRSGWSRATMNR